MASRLTMDAAETSSNFQLLSMRKEISLETVDFVERYLDMSDLVSLVFLLFENPDYALQQLCVATYHNHHMPGILSKWAQDVQTKEIKWQKKFLEALTIIQSYRVLRLLGYSKDDMYTQFLPFEPTATVYINPIYKALYRLCENLNPSKAKDLIDDMNCLCSDIADRPEYNIKFLEMYFLHWITRKYITVSGPMIDLSNLKRILKNRGFLTSYNNLIAVEGLRNFENDELVVSKQGSGFVHRAEWKQQDQTIYKFEQPDLNNRRLVRDRAAPESLANTRQCEPQDNSILSSNNSLQSFKRAGRNKCYAMNHSTAGLCIIINQRNFEYDPDHPKKLWMSENPLEEREGTDIDRDKLNKTFSKYGFKIINFENLIQSDIIPKIKSSIKEKFTAEDCCLIVCILSHGKPGAIYGSDSIYLDLCEIENCIQSTRFRMLLGKPKILITQACQGNANQRALHRNHQSTVSSSSEDEQEYQNTMDGPNKKLVETIPERTDFLTLKATGNGFAAVRNKKYGTWFISSLCKCLDKEAEQNDFEGILTTITDDVSAKRWGDRCMTPERTSTFRKKLYFYTQNQELNNNFGKTIL